MKPNYKKKIIQKNQYNNIQKINNLKNTTFATKKNYLFLTK